MVRSVENTSSCELTQDALPVRRRSQVNHDRKTGEVSNRVFNEQVASSTSSADARRKVRVSFSKEAVRTKTFIDKVLDLIKKGKLSETIKVFEARQAKNNPDCEESFKLICSNLIKLYTDEHLSKEDLADLLLALTRSISLPSGKVDALYGMATVLISWEYKSKYVVGLLKEFVQDPKAIEDHFNKHYMKGSRKDALEKYEVIKETISDVAESAWNSLIAHEIAVLAVSYNGKLNPFIFPALRREFLNHPNNRLAYEKQIAERLRFISLNTSDYDNTLRRVKLPKKDSIARLMLCAGLQKRIDVRLCSNDIRRFVVSQYLMDYRQIVGNCFTASPVIKVTAENALMFFEDMRKIAKRAYFTRGDEEEKTRFHGILQAPRDVQNLKLTDVDNLWEHPAIVAACKGMEVSREEAEQALKRLGKTPITLRECVKRIAKSVFEEEFRKEAYKKGLYFLEAFFRPAGMSVYENASASADLNITEQLHNALNRSLEDSFKKISELKSRTYNLICADFKRFFEEDTIFLYDPDCKFFKGRNKQHAGGYTLYRRDDSKLHGDWKKIECKEDFIFLLMRTFKKAVDLRRILETTKESLLKNMKDIFESDEFIEGILKAFDEKAKIPRNPENLNKMEKTPWKVIEGGNEGVVLSALIGTEMTSKYIKTIDEKNPEDILKKLLKTACTCNEGNKLIISNSDHAFTFMGNDPKIKDLLDDPKELQEKLDANLDIGSDIAETSVGRVLAEKMIEKLLSNLEDEENREQFEEDALLISTKLSICAYRKRLINLIKDYFRNSQKIAEELDLFIMQEGLTEELKSDFYDHMLMVCDSNWGEGGFQIYFAAAVNPGTNEVVFLQVREDKKVQNLLVGWPFQEELTLYLV